MGYADHTIRLDPIPILPETQEKIGEVAHVIHRKYVGGLWCMKKARLGVAG